jgi:hypothetical protein
MQNGHKSGLFLSVDNFGAAKARHSVRAAFFSKNFRATSAKMSEKASSAMLSAMSS